MANPFLVLGGIAVGLTVAGFGILQVPGWIADAQDASAQNDLAQIALAQATASSQTGQYTLLANLQSGWSDGFNAGIQMRPSAASHAHVSVNAHGDKWAAVVVSESGRVFVRTSDAKTVFASTGILADDPGTPLAGATIPAGLPAGITVSGTRAAPVVSLAGLGEGFKPENVLLDSSFSDPSIWPSAVNSRIEADGKTGQGGALRFDGSGGTRNIVVPISGGLYQPVETGQVWKVSGSYRTSADWNGTNNNSKLRLSNQAGELLTAAGARTKSDDEWTTVEITRRISSPTALRLSVVADNTQGSIWWDDITLERIE